MTQDEIKAKAIEVLLVRWPRIACCLDEAKRGDPYYRDTMKGVEAGLSGEVGEKTVLLAAVLKRDLDAVSPLVEALLVEHVLEIGNTARTLDVVEATLRDDVGIGIVLRDGSAPETN